MSGLFGSLSSAARALDAQRFGLDVVGQNMANVNTVGYTRREVDLAEVPPYEPRSAGGGVEVAGVRAVRDMLLERRFQQELPVAERYGAIADALGIVETALGKPGGSIDAKLTGFFDAFAGLAAEPTSATARQQVVIAGESLASSFQDMAERLDVAVRDTNTRILGGVDEANALIERIARLNTSIAGATGSGADAQHLRDEQGEAVRKLATLVNVGVMARQDGGVDVTIGPGRALVIGENAYSIATVQVPPSGLADLTLNGVSITGDVTGGRIGGLLHVRDTLVPQYENDLDRLAYGVVSEVNMLHDAGYTLAGMDAPPFFVPLATAAGAARAIAVDATVALDPSLVASAGIASGGDNQTARGIAALRDARVMSGGTATFHDSWGRLIYRAGTDTASAKSEQGSRDEIVRQLEGLRDATSGVSLDEEALMMLKFQRAYEANARFFTTVNGAIDTLMNMLHL